MKEVNMIIQPEFELLEQEQNKLYISWENGKHKFPIGPMKFIPKSGLLFYDIIKKISKNKKILDLGCGEMGIISLFAATNNASQITATDIDEKCIFWVNQLKKMYNLNNLTAFRSDVFQNIKGKFDIIVSNPPIMPMKEKNIHNIHDSGGPDGRFFLNKIMENSLSYLENNGQLFLSAFSFLGTENRTGDFPSIKEKALELGYSSFSIVKRTTKILKKDSVTYKQLPYIKTIYPKINIFEDNGMSAVEMQIICMKK